MLKTLACCEERLPPKPPAPTMNVVNWLMDSRSPASSIVSTDHRKREECNILLCYFPQILLTKLLLATKSHTVLKSSRVVGLFALPFYLTTKLLIHALLSTRSERSIADKMVSFVNPLSYVASIYYTCDRLTVDYNDCSRLLVQHIHQSPHTCHSTCIHQHKQ